MSVQDLALIRQMLQARLAAGPRHPLGTRLRTDLDPPALTGTEETASQRLVTGNEDAFRPA